MFIGRLREQGAPLCEGVPPNQPVEALHDRLPFHPEIRHLIDAHLLSVWVSASSPPPEYILPPADAYHYHNLPNLVPLLRIFLVSNAWESDLIGTLMSPFCLHINRALKPQHLAPSTRSSRVAAVNVLHGLLLGLYPFSMRQPGFARRVAVAGWLREAMCAAGDTPTAPEFIRRNEALLTLAMAEYLANVICDFCPVEEALLIKLPQCRFVLNHLCDTFRGDTEVVPLDELNGRALAALASVQRQLKVCNHRPCKRTVMRAQCHRVTPEDVRGALDTPLVSPGSVNLVAQIQLIRPELDFVRIQAVEFIWQSVGIRNLPRSVYEAQRRTMEARGSCRRLQGALALVHLCLKCALGSKPLLAQHKCSYDCATGRLFCTHCAEQMQAVHLLGRVLSVRGTSFYLCPVCLIPTTWIDGCGPCLRCQDASVIPPRQCAACDSRSIASTREIVDWANLCMDFVPLCHRHSRSCIASHNVIYDMAALEADVLAISASKARNRS